MRGKEIDAMVSENVIPSKSYFGGAASYCFTEQGVTMLSCILNSKTAIEVNLQVVKAFVKMRAYQHTNHDCVMQSAESCTVIQYING